jgi:hypothetical protein
MFKSLALVIVSPPALHCSGLQLYPLVCGCCRQGCRHQVYKEVFTTSHRPRDRAVPRLRVRCCRTHRGPDETMTKAKGFLDDHTPSHTCSPNLNIDYLGKLSGPGGHRCIAAIIELQVARPNDGGRRESD